VVESLSFQFCMVTSLGLFQLKVLLISRSSYSKSFTMGNMAITQKSVIGNEVQDTQMPRGHDYKEVGGRATPGAVAEDDQERRVIGYW